MKELDLTAISAIMASVSTVAAIIAPVIATIYTAKLQDRAKKMEMYIPRAYDALAEMAKTYSQMLRKNTAGGDEESQRAQYVLATNAYHEFMAASYKVMSLIPGKSIHDQISELLTEVELFGFSPNPRHDELFCQLMEDINDYLRTSKIKNKKQNAKDKV